MTELSNFLDPPADLPQIQRGNWFHVPVNDILVQYIESEYWDQPERPTRWQAARLSGAVYLYREADTGWTIVVKYYKVKTAEKAAKYAQQELKLNQAAYTQYLPGDGIRSIKPLGVWRGTLFLEYADGLTLEDMIAVRRSRPGVLLESLDQSARLLAELHSHPLDGDGAGAFQDAVRKTRKILDNLYQHGILENEPLIQAGLDALLERWSAYAWMISPHVAPSHGDATTSNFVFPWSGGIVAIDWERASFADPAFDLGRLCAEVAHSITQHGGDMVEAEPFVDHLVGTYIHALTGDWDTPELLRRANFYRASSTLRIARNGWVSRLDRMALVTQAYSLLTRQT